MQGSAAPREASEGTLHAKEVGLKKPIGNAQRPAQK